MLDVLRVLAGLALAYWPVTLIVIALVVATLLQEAEARTRL